MKVQVLEVKEAGVGAMEEVSVSRMEGHWRDNQAVVKQPSRMLGTKETYQRILYQGWAEEGGCGWGWFPEQIWN